MLGNSRFLGDSIAQGRTILIDTHSCASFELFWYVFAYILGLMVMLFFARSTSMWPDVQVERRLFQAAISSCTQLNDFSQNGDLLRIVVGCLDWNRHQNKIDTWSNLAFPVEETPMSAFSLVGFLDRLCVIIHGFTIFWGLGMIGGYHMVPRFVDVRPTGGRWRCGDPDEKQTFGIHFGRSCGNANEMNPLGIVQSKWGTRQIWL